MELYLVEVRLSYEVQSTTADEALKLVSASVRDTQAIGIEYSVRERKELLAEDGVPNAPDPHGLTKPVYTVSEVASILGTSRSLVYEFVRRSTTCIRLGRRVLIPRIALIGLLNGELAPSEPVRSTAVAPTVARRSPRPPKKSTTLDVVTTPLRRRRPRQERNEKDPVSISEAARILHISTSRLGELLEGRKIYYTEHYGKRSIPKRALENFVNGLPAIALLEENIAHYRANNQMDDEMEEIAAKLLAEWKSDAG